MLQVFLKSNGKKRLVFENARVADNSFKRFKGLMLERKECFDCALVFKMPSESRISSSIHMLFMNFPIDALFLDSGKRIVDIAHCLKPWSLNYTPKKAAKFVIEIPAGSAAKKGLKIGKTLFFN